MRGVLLVADSPAALTGALASVLRARPAARGVGPYRSLPPLGEVTSSPCEVPVYELETVEPSRARERRKTRPASLRDSASRRGFPWSRARERAVCASVSPATKTPCRAPARTRKVCAACRLRRGRVRVAASSNPMTHARVFGACRNPGAFTPLRAVLLALKALPSEPSGRASWLERQRRHGRAPRVCAVQCSARRAFGTCHTRGAAAARPTRRGRCTAYPLECGHRSGGARSSTRG